MPEILAANGLGCALMVMLQISRHMTRRNRRLDDHLFSALIFSVLLASVLEVLSFLVDGRPGPVFRWINLLSNTGLYALTTVVSSLWLLYVEMHLFRDRRRLRRLLRWVRIPALLLMAALVVNLFVSIFFRVDEENVYHRLPVGYVFYVYLSLAFLGSIWIFRRHRREFRKAQFFPLPMFLIPVILSSVIQILFYGISLSWAGVAVGVVGVYLNLQSRQSFVDGLTGLYNRQFLEHEMFIAREGRPSPYYGIMLDVDRFKEINDRLGHSVGDAALSHTAEILLRAVGMDGQIFRYAGDEFIVILRTDLEAEAVAVEERIREECRRFNESAARAYQLSLSMGHGRFDPAVDSEDSFLRRIDQKMYEDKIRRHRHREASR